MDINFNITMPTEDIYMRDPCILLHENKYYMYCSIPPGYGCYVSQDLQNWAGPFKVFHPPAGHSGTDCWWAPECHKYQGEFYLFATYKSAKTEKRGVSIFQSDAPLGPFKEISRPCPEDWDTIDGTLYVDNNDTPWMVFVHEFTSMPDGIGDFSLAKLNNDLTQFISEPIPLFKASELPTNPNNHVTDGCWPYRTKTGRLLMIWSGFTQSGYVVATAHSLTNDITGPWEQLPQLLYERGSGIAEEGGHGMIFTTYNGQLMLSLHSPNGGGQERAKFIELEDTGDTLRVRGEHK